MPAEVELDHRHTQELGVATDIGRHWHLEVLVGVGIREGFEGLWRVANSGDWNILDNEVSVLEIGLSMLRAEEQLKVDVFTSRYSSLSWADSVVCLLVFERDLLRILLFIDAPMEWNSDGRGVAHPNDPPALTRRISVLKVDGLKRILLEIDVLTVYGYDVEVHDSTVPSELVELRSLVVASKDEVFLQLAFSLWVERDINVDGRARVEVEFRRCQSKATNSNGVGVSLP